MAYWRLNQECKKCDKFKVKKCKGMKLCPFETHDHAACWIREGKTYKQILNACFAK